MAHTIVGFDMGIRNLAYCVVRHEGDAWKILAWDNVDLLEGGVSSQISKQCCACTSPAIWMDPVGSKWCKGCAAGTKRKAALAKKPSHPCVPCALTVKALRPLAGLDKKAKKEDLIAWATSRYLVPWKPAKAMDASLTTIRKAMDTWLTSVLPTFASASLIRLENQPVMKGPTMKSVQMILFTLLGHRLEREHGWTGALEFVHAGTKSKGIVATVTPATAAVEPATAAAATDTTKADGVAYRNRKKTAESDVAALLSSTPEWLSFFNGRSKKSDLADAFLMAHRARSTA
jgi:hypothetical protein